MDGNSLEEHVSSVPDPRKNFWLQRHSLRDILLISICATIGGADTFEDIAAFGRAKLDWFKDFLDLPNGIPSHDTFNRMFERLDHAAFKECFLSWVNGVCELCSGEVIAIDGKTMRGSGGAAHKALHVVSAWACSNGLVIGQKATEEKSNEITAIPRLLELIKVKGCIVTIDAMGCQKEIAEKIIDSEGDYVLSLKGNQGSLHEDIKLNFEGVREEVLHEKTSDHHSSVDANHGRIETRKYWITDDIDWLVQKEDWPGLKSVGIVESQREINGETSTERRYFISSISPDAKVFANAVRSHWLVENSLHWMLDVTFNEDRNRVKGQAALNLGQLRHFALNILKSDKSKGSIAGKRKKAGWDNDFLKKLVENHVL